MDFDHAGQDNGAGRLEPADKELVARTVHDIDARSEGDHEALLSAMLTAAWPAPMSQMQ